MTPIPFSQVTMTEALPSWHDGAAKSAITDFVERAGRRLRDFEQPEMSFNENSVVSVNSCSIYFWKVFHG